MRARILTLLGGIALACLACGDGGQQTDGGGQSEAVPPASKAKITFLELGSVSCIPCREMQPVMESTERKYGDQVLVVFHDVWRHPNVAKQYNIRLIPTQIFLDENQVEIMRHEGFLPESAIDEFLQSRGLTVVTDRSAL